MYNHELIFKMLDKSSRLTGVLEKNIQDLATTSNGTSNESTQKLLEQVFNHYEKFHATPLIVETDKNGVITMVNDDFAKLAEYEPQEMIGQNINILRSSRMEHGLFTDLWNHLLDGKPWTGQIQNRTKNVSSYWIDTLVCPVFDESGNPIKFWSLSFDISDLMKQKDEIELKNKDIEESLQYAKRIQRTILPSKKDMDEVLEDYFVLYKPKDIVSGDFYWFTKTVDKAFVAVVDCTGHGVPGAFMSLIGYTILNQIVKGENIIQPGLILTELHRHIRQTLKQDSEGSSSKDGMDVSILVFDRYSEKAEYSGAFRPLYLWNGSDLKIIEGDKMSIGGEQLEEERIFTNHEFEIEPEHILYMFSDGIVDQFGGPAEKKFSTKRLRDIIVQNHKESMSVQKALFNLEWKEWKGDGPQTDDVTMIGIKF